MIQIRIHSLDEEVALAEVDKVVPLPVLHVEQVLHAGQVHGEQRGSTPDGGATRGGQPNVVEGRGQGG